MSEQAGRSRPVERPRILIDAIAYSPRDGGFTTALHDLLDTCRRLPEFDFVIVHAKTHRPVFQAYGLPTYSVAVPRSLRFFVSVLLLPLIARRLKPAAVHCEISALPMFMGVPGSVTVHDLYFLIEPIAGGRSIRRRVMDAYWRRVFVRSLHRARFVKSISHTTADDLRRLISPDLPVVVCEPRFVAPPGPAAIRRLPEPEQDLRLLFVGSLVPRKNLQFLLRSLRLVRRRWRLDIVGNVWWGAGELEPAKHDARVKVHGFLPDFERDQLMAESHLLIATSRYEGFGYPAAEAMVRGLPCFASDVAGFREFVPAEWRFPLDEPAALASMIDAVDEARYQNMPSVARAAVARFSRDAHIQNHRHLISALVSAPSAVADGTSARP